MIGRILSRDGLALSAFCVFAGEVVLVRAAWGRSCNHTFALQSKHARSKAVRPIDLRDTTQVTFHSVTLCIDARPAAGTWLTGSCYEMAETADADGIDPADPTIRFRHERRKIKTTRQQAWSFLQRGSKVHPVRYNALLTVKIAVSVKIKTG